MSDKDDSTIDLSKLGSDEDDGGSSSDSGLKEVGEENEEFKIDYLESSRDMRPHFDEEIVKEAEILGRGSAGISSVRDGTFGESGEKADSFSPSVSAADKVKVKFDKFITLVATHTYEDILKKNADEDVIISTNLLTDLANAHDDSSGSSKKVPILFGLGILIGVVVTWLILRT
jgi:hypothetical protein